MKFTINADILTKKLFKTLEKKKLGHLISCNLVKAFNKDLCIFYNAK